MQAHCCIGFPSFRILEFVLVRVEVGPVNVHRELRHFAFVEANKGDAGPVTVPLVSAYKSELLFVYPIGYPIDDASFLTV